MKTFSRFAIAVLCLALGGPAASAAGLGGGVSPVGTAPYNLNANGAAPAATSTPVVQALDQPVSSANQQVKINVNANVATLVLAHSGTMTTYVTHWFAIVGAAVNFKWVYGTGTNCGTGQTDITGLIPLQAAGSGASPGNGGFTIMTVPAGQDLCGVPDTAVQIGGLLDYQRR